MRDRDRVQHFIGSHEALQLRRKAAIYGENCSLPIGCPVGQVECHGAAFLGGGCDWRQEYARNSCQPCGSSTGLMTLPSAEACSASLISSSRNVLISLSNGNIPCRQSVISFGMNTWGTVLPSTIPVMLRPSSIAGVHDDVAVRQTEQTADAGGSQRLQCDHSDVSQAGRVESEM